MHLLSEVKVSYFYSTNADFKNIYSSGGGLYRLETSLEAYKNLYPFLSVGYFETSGHSQGQQSPTKLKMVPISPGLKYFFLEKKKLRPYLGAGILTSYLHIYNDSPYVIKVQSKWGVGGLFQGGFIAYITRSFIIDGFIDYSYMNIHFKNTRSANVSGLSIGGGLGYAF